MTQRTLFALVCALGFWSTACASSVDPPVGGDSNNDTTGQEEGCQDLDGDGFPGRTATCPFGTDCDDASAQINPGAAEICGDRIDNNCDGQVDEGCEAECIDNDGDRYGVGPGCLGPDCDDTNPAINPGATEICGNGIDDDCMNGDAVCPSNCVDNDGDGYGAPGSTDCRDAQGQLVTEVDCDDNNAAVNPGATEVCDGIDNNCDGQIDECANPEQSCNANGGTCQGGAGVACENANDCAGDFLTCDTSQNPKVCKSAENGDCQVQSDCVDGLACENGTCVGNFCLNSPCVNGAPYDVCDRAGGLCVECPHFDPDIPTQDAACDDGQQCVAGGWCAYNDLLETNSTPPYDITTEEEVFWINIWMADCWLTTRPGGIKKMCSAFFVPSDAIVITEEIARNAYLDGHLNNELTADENDALHDIWGRGLFNRKEIDWNANPIPGTAKEICLWYQKGSLFTGETLVLDKCENFSP